VISSAHYLHLALRPGLSPHPGSSLNLPTRQFLMVGPLREEEEGNTLLIISLRDIKGTRNIPLLLNPARGLKKKS